MCVLGLSCTLRRPTLRPGAWCALAMVLRVSAGLWKGCRRTAAGTELGCGTHRAQPASCANSQRYRKAALTPLQGHSTLVAGVQSTFGVCGGHGGYAWSYGSGPATVAGGWCSQCNEYACLCMSTRARVCVCMYCVCTRACVCEREIERKREHLHVLCA